MTWISRALVSLSALSIALGEPTPPTGTELLSEFLSTERGLEAFTVSCRAAPTLFVQLNFADAAEVAPLIQSMFPGDPPPLWALPDPRTNRVFLMGDQQALEAAEDILRFIDRTSW